MRNPVTHLFGIASPIMLGAFGGVSSVELTAAVSELGGLGAYGLYGYDATRVDETVAALKQQTARFALNLWLPFEEPAHAGAAARWEDAAAALAPFFDELGLAHPVQPESYLPSFEEQFAAVLEAAPTAVSFIFGVPSVEVVEAAHRAGIVVVGSATTVAEAIALEHGGVDAVVATGSEAAGHRVSFLLPPEDSLVGTMALVPQVVDAVSVPVIAAGGIADRRGVAAAFALGASGVQVGTAFLRTRESAANEAYRAAIVSGSATVLTRAMSGRLARGIPNRAMRSIEESGVIAPFPEQNWLTGQFRAEAGRRGLGELQSLWAGQAAALALHTDAAELFAELAAGVPAS